MRHDYNVRINDPSIAAAWAAACKENDDAEAAMIAELRAWGVKGARPDDGHVDRVQNYFGMAYPWYNDGVAAGDLFALGRPGKLRLVRIERVADAGGLLSGYTRFWFTPEGCATCLCMVTTAMRPWPTMGDEPHALCASCTADVDRSRSSGLTTPRTAKSIAQWCRSACQKKAPRLSATIARWIRRLVPCLTLFALLPASACAGGQTNDTPDAIGMKHMFDEEFFPTPKAVVKQMLAPLLKVDDGIDDNLKAAYGRAHLSDMLILEPSAGSGAMLDVLNDIINPHSYRRSEDKVHCIERNPDLQAVLKEKGHRVVHDDFLTYTTDLRYDLILMNPPFSNGDEHLLHAWDILHEGDIVCLLNASTIKVPYTERRKTLKALIEAHGTVEFIGQAFARGERRSDVEVALVRLRKNDTNSTFRFFEDSTLDGEQDVPEDFNFTEGNVNTPAVNDLVRLLVGQFQEAQHAFTGYMKARAEIHRKLSTFEGSHVYSRHDDILAESVKAGKPAHQYNEFTRLLKQRAWALVFARTKLHDLMTKSVRTGFEAMQQEQGHMQFSEPNIYALFEMLFLNRHEILKQSLVDAFEMMTKYHADNRLVEEGWATNDAYKVNRKVIMPGAVEGNYSGGMALKYTYADTINDVDRALAMLNGKKLSQVYSAREALEKHLVGFKRTSGVLENNVVVSEHFKMRFFKKGTMHLWFLSEDLWERFNIEAAKGKNWLPADYRSSAKGRRGASGTRPEDAVKNADTKTSADDADVTDNRPDRAQQLLLNA